MSMYDFDKLVEKYFTKKEPWSEFYPFGYDESQYSIYDMPLFVDDEKAVEAAAAEAKAADEDCNISTDEELFDFLGGVVNDYK